jgi:Zn-dependent peptidase ImmA (M78 family)
METLDPSWVWLGKELLNSESVSYSDPNTFKECVKSALFANTIRLLKETGQSNPPYHPERIAEIRKAKILKLPLEYDGMLIPTKDGFTMKINSDMPLVHQRFVCAHEIGHTFFFNIETSPPSKPFVIHKNRHWAEENIANRIAREILMPEPVIRSHLEQAKPPYIEDFKQIMKLFLVSSEVLAWRIRELKTWKALILIFEMNDEFEIKLHGTFNCNYKKLNVAKKGTPVKDPIFYNILHKAYIDEGGVIIRENVTVLIGDFKRHCARIATTYIGNSPTKILAIIPL